MNMKQIILIAALFLPSPCLAGQGTWNYLEVQSAHEGKDWDIYRTPVTILLSGDAFSSDSFVPFFRNSLIAFIVTK